MRVCDKCHKEIRDNENSYITTLLDLCEECYKEIKDEKL